MAFYFASTVYRPLKLRATPALHPEWCPLLKLLVSLAVQLEWNFQISAVIIPCVLHGLFFVVDWPAAVSVAHLVVFRFLSVVTIAQVLAIRFPAVESVVPVVNFVPFDLQISCLSVIRLSQAIFCQMRTFCAVECCVVFRFHNFNSTPVSFSVVWYLFIFFLKKSWQFFLWIKLKVNTHSNSCTYGLHCKNYFLNITLGLLFSY